MADILQTQKSFAYGQTGLTGFSNITENYDHSCKKLKNVIVNKNGSIRVRGGWAGVEASFNLPENTKIRDVFNVEENFIFWLESLDGKNFKGEGLYIYDKTEENLEKMQFDFNYSYIYGERLSDIEENKIEFPAKEQFDGRGREHGFEDLDMNNIVNVLPFENFLYVFFKGCFPFIVKSGDGVVATAPFYHGVGEDKIWKAFPFNYTTKRRTIGSYFYRKSEDNQFYPALNQEEKLKLRIGNVKMEAKECEAWIEPQEGRLPSELYIDKRYASLQNFIGKPIAFQIGLKDFRVQKRVTSEDREDYLDNFYGRSLRVTSKCSSANFEMPEFRVNIATIYPGWNAERQSTYYIRLYKRTGKTREELEQNIKDYAIRYVTGRIAVFGNGKTSSGSINNGLGLNPPPRNRFTKSQEKDGKIVTVYDSEAYAKALTDYSHDTGLKITEIGNLVASEGINRIVAKEESSSTLCDLRRNIRTRTVGSDTDLNKILELSPKVDVNGVSTTLKVKLTQESIDAIEDYLTSARSSREDEEQSLYSQALLDLHWQNKNLSFHAIGENGATIEGSKIYISKGSSRGVLSLIASDILGNSVTLGVYTMPKNFRPEAEGGEDVEGVFTVDNPVNDSVPLPETLLKGVSASDTVQQVLVKEAYNFYVIFPYAIVGSENVDSSNRYLSVSNRNNIGQTLKAKCRIYEIGSQLSNDDLAGDNLGRFDESPHYLESEDFIFTDWADGWPKSGDVLNEKYFFFTSKSKLSFSKTEKPYIWGNPIKSLLNGPKYNLQYQENINRPNDDDADLANTKRFQTLLREDFKYPTEAITEFFDEINRGNESKEGLVSDPLTYRIEDKNGLPVEIRRHFMVSAGVLTSVGIQCIFFTDKGTFYWGLAPRDGDFLKLANVSNFIGGKGPQGYDLGIAEVLTKVFAGSEDGELHMANYDPNNRNFIAEPAGVDRGFKGFVHGVNFRGNRLLFIDRFSEKMFCSNVGPRGHLMGVSEWEVPDWTPKGLWKFGNDYFSAFQKGNNIRLLKYDDDIKLDIFDDAQAKDLKENIEKGQDHTNITAEVETAPLTWKAKFASDPCLHIEKQINRIFFFTNYPIRRLTGPILETPLSENITLLLPNGSNINLVGSVIQSAKNKGADDIVSVTKSYKVPAGQGFKFKFFGATTISGVVMYINASA